MVCEIGPQLVRKTHIAGLRTGDPRSLIRKLNSWALESYKYMAWMMKQGGTKFNFKNFPKIELCDKTVECHVATCHSNGTRLMSPSRLRVWAMS